MGKAKQNTERSQRQGLAVSLRAEGKTITEIAQTIGTEVQEAIDLLAEENEKVKTLRGVKLEAFCIENQADTRGRVQQLSQIRQRLTEELAKRDLTDLPTDKLITLLIKINESLKVEFNIPPIFSTEYQVNRNIGAWAEEHNKINL